MPLSFNEQVYALVRRIPPSKVLSYGRVAWLLGVPHGARAVGWALHSLPNGTDVPWQRVISAKGYVSNRSYPGAAELQRELLEAEGVHFDLTGHVDLSAVQWETSEWEARTIIDEATGATGAKSQATRQIK